MPSPSSGLRQRQTYASNGMVATASAVATQAGLAVLRRGGNAVDAAVAAATVTWTTLPMLAGPGGDAFLLIQKRDESAVAINGSGPVGHRATIDFIRSRGYTLGMPLEGPLSVAVPGAVAAFDTALSEFGTLGWADVLADAIQYAEGHVVTEYAARWFARGQRIVRRNRAAREIYAPRGRPPSARSVLRQPAYAQTLRTIAAGGADAFYRGELGERIGKHYEASGLFGRADLSSMSTDSYRPLTTEYERHRVYQLGPPSQGVIHLLALNIVNGFGRLGELDSARALHVQIEAKKLAFADRNRYLGDPRHVVVPLEYLLSTEHAVALARKINLDSVHPSDGGSDIGGDTTSLCVVDREGTAVSLIQSLSAAFGSGDVVDGTGIFMNNRAGRGFMLKEGHPNAIAPNKRTVHTLNCYIVSKDARARLVGGTPGGDGQVQWNLQAVVNYLNYGMSVGEIVGAPRWTHEPSADPATLGATPTVTLEADFGSVVIAELKAIGHRVQKIPALTMIGNLQLIEIDWERGVLIGASDPRGEGVAGGI